MKVCYTCKLPTNNNRYQCNNCNNQRLKDRRKALRELNRKIEMNWEGNKICYMCKEELPRTRFTQNENEADRLKSSCKDCSVIIQLIKLSKFNDYRINLPENITGKFLRDIKKFQRYKCVLCGTKENGRSLHLDHDHKTGLIRGYVCHFCNRTLIPTLEKYPEIRELHLAWKTYFSPKNFIQLIKLGYPFS